MKKRSTAWAILVAVLVLGTIFGTWRSVAGLSRGLTEAFYRGVDGSGYGIATNLDLRVEYARNLCKIAAGYDADAEVRAVEDACAHLEDVKGFADKYDANNTLTDAVDALDIALQRQNLSAEDEGYRKSLTADIASFEMRIDKLASAFNAEVRQKQGSVSGFARLIGNLTGVGGLEEYA